MTNTLEDLSDLWKEIVVTFSNADEFIKAVPQTKPDLSLVLTRWATIWVESKRSGSSTYHLHYPYNNESFPIIEYINQEWFYLNWNLGKYYTKPLSQITTPLSLGLGTYQTPLVNALCFSDNSVGTLSDSGSSNKTESILKNGKELVYMHGQKVEHTNQVAGVVKHNNSVTLGFNESILPRMATNTLQVLQSGLFFSFT